MLSQRNVEITRLKASLQQVQVEGPGTTEALRSEVGTLKATVEALTTENAGLQGEVKGHTRQFLHAHAAENDHMTFLLRPLAPNPSPS